MYDVYVVFAFVGFALQVFVVTCRSDLLIIRWRRLTNDVECCIIYVGE